MTTMIVPTTLDNNTAMLIDVQVKAEVIAAEIARRKATVFLGMNVGNLLRAENPELLLGDPLVWRMDVKLTSPRLGTIQSIGRIYVNAVSGSIRNQQYLIEQLTSNLDALTCS